MRAHKRQAPDHGATGPAMAARVGYIAETRVAGVTRRIMQDDHLIDRMEAARLLNPDQAETARRLLRIAHAAGLMARGVARMGALARGEEIPDDMAEARATWNALLRRHCDAAEAWLIHGVVVDGELRRPGATPIVRAVLDTIAAGWRSEAQLSGFGWQGENNA